MTPQERFERYVSPEPNTGCWLWGGASDSRSGYGYFNAGSKRTTKTHRFAWERAHGQIPAGMHVCHRCDQPACVNPAHLFLGTHAENMADREAKKRNRPPRGESHGMAKLTAVSVIAIRALVAAGAASRREIGRRHGVTGETVRAVVAREIWAHVE